MQEVGDKIYGVQPLLHPAGLGVKVGTALCNDGHLQPAWRLLWNVGPPPRRNHSMANTVLK